MMSGSNKPLVFSFLLFFCMSTSFKLCYTSVVCPQIEKQALLKFKQSLEDPSNLLSSWNITSENNCCLWKGVVCSNLTGHVHQLHLQNPDEFEAGLRGEVNPSLLYLKELQYLDLSGNDFGVSIPSFFGLLTSLEYLNLSFAKFHGRIPHSIGNLSNLHTLSLDGFGVWESDDGLGVDSMEWLSGLSGLEYLSMNEVNLSKAANWVEVINTLPSLLHLQLTYCSLNSMPPLKHLNTTSLSILDLSGNDFDSLPMPTWVFKLPSLLELYLGSCLFKPPLTVSDFNSTSLTKLDLSGNFFDSFPMPRWIFQHPNLIFLYLTSSGLEGPIPSVSNTTKLKYIDLSYNFNINSSIPDWLYLCKHLEFVSMRFNSLQNTISNDIGNLTSLNTLDLSYNQLSGNIPRQIASLCNLQMLKLSGNMLGGEISDSFGNMSDCFLEGVTSLYLKYNKLSGHLTPQFGEFKSLQNLYLSQNSISGAIPTHLGNLSSLYMLALGNNNLSGNLPESLGQLLNLGFLDIEYNMLEGMVTETHFSNLSKLEVSIASGNHLSMKISSNWVPPFALETLQLGSWNLGAHNNIPSWIERHKSITWLDLSNAGISGNIPSWFWEINVLNLSHNNLQGQIPDINGLVQVYLSCNQFSGSLPRVADTVAMLDLSNNSFTAGLSHFLCHPTNQTYRLEFLLLGGNQLTGELPDCLMKWSSLVMLNLANNKLSGNIPNSIGFLADLRSLNLHGNKFWGQIPFSMHKCTKLLKLDLGGNRLAGNIQAWTVTSSAKLMFLILRSNKLSGEIPSDICHLNALQILDLSDNAFSGVIPKCINNFTAMATKRSLDYYSRELSGIHVFKGRRYMYSYYSTPFHESAWVATKGREYEYDTILSLVTNIDLSNNNLSGDIPKELTSLVELRSLNFSGNRLTGSIPDGMGDMKQLESLDLSRNSLMGEIPNSFTLMYSLSYLDLSFNNLTGRIPSSTQLLGMNASSFDGNHLCDPPLPNKCSNGDPPVGVDAHDDEDGESKIDWFYVFSSLGYAVGLSACCSALMLKKSWRDAYFGLLECIWEKVYVYFCIKWMRLTATRAPIS